MPTLEHTEYERFSYEENVASLSLDEAIKRASDLRKADSTHFYRIERVDPTSDAFRVDKVSVASAYAEFMARIASNLGRFARLSRRA